MTASTEDHVPDESPPDEPQECCASRPLAPLAMASLALSCLTVFFGPFGCIPGIICGHIARADCRKRPELEGASMALAGLLVGYASLVLLVLFGIARTLASGTMRIHGPPGA